MNKQMFNMVDFSVYTVDEVREAILNIKDVTLDGITGRIINFSGINIWVEDSEGNHAVTNNPNEIEGFSDKLETELEKITRDWFRVVITQDEEQWFGKDMFMSQVKKLEFFEFFNDDMTHVIMETTTDGMVRVNMTPQTIIELVTV